MIDAMLYNGINNDPWHLDVDIQRGRFVEMDKPPELNTKRQRKAVLAYQIIGTIPGDWQRGVDWAKIINSAGQMPLADAMMQVQMAIEGDEGLSASGSFTIPIIGQDQDSATIRLLTVSPDDLEELKNGGT